jgi:hypothetical protein
LLFQEGGSVVKEGGKIGFRRLLGRRSIVER